jgi:CHAT domain-containing protein/Tfp pilus assembly protein PilF
VGAAIVNALGSLHERTGLHELASVELQIAARVARTLSPPDAHLLGETLVGLAAALAYQGLFEDAERFGREGLVQLERNGRTHPDLRPALTELASVYADQERTDEAVAYQKRALDVALANFPPRHPFVTDALFNYATLLGRTGALKEATELLESVLKRDEVSLGRQHPDLASTLNSLGWIYQSSQRYDDAERMYKRALDIMEKLKPDGRGVAVVLDNLAWLYREQHEYAKAQPLQQRATRLFEPLVASDPLGLAASLRGMAELQRLQNHPDEALVTLRRAVAIYQQRLLQFRDPRFAAAQREQIRRSSAFADHVSLLHEVVQRSPSRWPEVADEAFQSSQLIRVTSTSRVVSEAAARLSVGNDAQATAIRRRQEATDQLRALDRAAVEALGRAPDVRQPVDEARVRMAIDALEKEIANLDLTLSRSLSPYADFTSLAPISLTEVQQRQLTGEDALVFYVAAHERLFLWVVRADQAALRPLDITRRQLVEDIARLRKALEGPGNRPSSANTPYDLALAHQLYLKVLAPAVPLLTGVHHLYLVPDAALEGLPFSALLTAPPSASNLDFARYREQPWLVRSYAISVLPDVRSLAALRRATRTSRASQPFVGFGDPAMGPQAGVGSLAGPRRNAAFPPLPDTAVELFDMATALGGNPSNVVFLQKSATKAHLHQVKLSDFRVVAFATHGVIAGELAGQVEPGLLLSSSGDASGNDGFVPASEIARLTMDADLVVLSACNTAAPDGSDGAEGLSGLAKAFFFAGTRSLLVSHWQVESRAAATLTIRTIKGLAEYPTFRTADALQAAMTSLLEDQSSPGNAHPTIWAPFIAVGVGGGRALPAPPK